MATRLDVWGKDVFLKIRHDYAESKDGKRAGRPKRGRRRRRRGRARVQGRWGQNAGADVAGFA